MTENNNKDSQHEDQIESIAKQGGKLFADNQKIVKENEEVDKKIKSLEVKISSIESLKPEIEVKIRLLDEEMKLSKEDFENYKQVVQQETQDSAQNYAQKKQEDMRSSVTLSMQPGAVSHGRINAGYQKIIQQEIQDRQTEIQEESRNELEKQKTIHDALMASKKKDLDKLKGQLTTLKSNKENLKKLNKTFNQNNIKIQDNKKQIESGNFQSQELVNAVQASQETLVQTKKPQVSTANIKTQNQEIPL